MENERNRQRMKGSKATFGLRYGKLELQPMVKPSKLLEEAAKKEFEEDRSSKTSEVISDDDSGGASEKKPPLQNFYNRLANLKHKLGSKFSISMRLPEFPPEPAPRRSEPQLVWEDTRTVAPRPPILKNSGAGFSAKEYKVIRGRGGEAPPPTTPSRARRKSVSFGEDPVYFHRAQYARDDEDLLLEALAENSPPPTVSWARRNRMQKSGCSSSDKDDQVLQQEEQQRRDPTKETTRDLARRLANESAESFFSTATVVTESDSKSTDDDDDSGFEYVGSPDGPS